MPSITADIQFLANLPLYQQEKPFLYLPSIHDGLDPDLDRLSNLEFETHKNILIRDMREYPDILDFNECGFEYYAHPSSVKDIQDGEDMERYKRETEELLKGRFGAIKVHTYEARLRENKHFERKQFNYNDGMIVEGPALGAHNDVTYVSGPQIIRRYLPIKDQEAFLQPEYRVRIINTWRPLLEVLEDRPLALCDARSISADDLVPADRVLPNKVGEIYYLRHSAEHRWYWLEHQKSSEPFIMLMYDTCPGINPAYLCPHVSIDNKRKSADAQLRRSVETRSIMITKVEQ